MGLVMRTWTREKDVRASGVERDALRGTLEYRACIGRDEILSCRWILVLFVYFRLERVARLAIQPVKLKAAFWSTEKRISSKDHCFLWLSRVIMFRVESLKLTEAIFTELRPSRRRGMSFCVYKKKSSDRFQSECLAGRTMVIGWEACVLLNQI